MRLKLLVVAAICSVFIVSTPNPRKVYACNCIKDTVKNALTASDAVFVGKIISSSSVKEPNVNGGRYTSITYIFEVSQAWKGVTTTHVEAVYFTDYVDAVGNQIFECPPTEGFAVGDTYLVYARKSEITGKLHTATGSCTHTNLFRDATEDIKQLGAGKEIPAQPPISGTGEESPDLWLLVLGAAGILGFGVVVTWMRRSTPTRS